MTSKKGDQWHPRPVASDLNDWPFYIKFFNTRIETTKRHRTRRGLLLKSIQRRTCQWWSFHRHFDATYRYLNGNIMNINIRVMSHHEPWLGASSLFKSLRLMLWIRLRGAQDSHTIKWEGWPLNFKLQVMGPYFTDFQHIGMFLEGFLFGKTRTRISFFFFSQLRIRPVTVLIMAWH